MASFDIAKVILAQKEGGMSKDVTDKGNYLNSADYAARRNFIGTNHGIAAPTLSAYYGRAVTHQEMLDLPYATALKIYKRDYWDSIQLSEVQNQSLANLIFDGAVNQGVGAIKIVYKNTTGETLTADSVNKQNQKQLFDKIQQGRIARYNSADSHYNGWVARVKSYVYDGATSATNFTKKHILAISLISVGAAAVIGIGLYLIIMNKHK